MGRHALLEAPDAPAVTLSAAAAPAASTGVDPTEVRTVAEIIAQFRREQGLPVLPHRRDPSAGTESVAPAPEPPAESAAPVAVEHPPVDDHDDHPSGPPVTALPTTALPTTAGPADAGPATGELAAVRARREAALESALRPGGAAPSGPRRRRAASGSNASSVIASLTAELSSSHPGLLEGTPHSRRAERPAVRTAAAGNAPTLRPVRVSAGLRGGALRVPALASGWRVPTRTPLVIAGAVAVSVVVTDQAGLLSSAESTASTAAAGTQHDVAATTPVDQTAATSAASEGARQARARVSRLERSPLTATAAPTGAVTGTATGTAVTAAGTGTAAAAAPPPDSVMKPGQTVPGDWVRPSAKGIYNSCFCARWGTFHAGIDFAAPLGSPILAVGDGVVVQAGPASGFGNWVIIRHANGDMTVYGHMKYYFVKIGQKVKAGQEIALVGEEGEATGPHLHLGVKIGSTTGHDGTYVDPVPWLKARGIAVGTYNANG